MGVSEAIVGQVALGDRRLARRLESLVETFAEQPEQSIPQACATWARTVAAYRFFTNEHVAPEAIVAGLAAATGARCAEDAVVLAVQDTTSRDYTAHPQTTGLGPLEHPARRGLFVHTTLAVSGATGVPLGLLDQQVGARPEAPGGPRQRHQVPLEAKESARWVRAVRHTEAPLGATARVVTVADREADVYELFAVAHELHGDWVIRARHDRALADEAQRLVATVEQAPVCATTTVEVARTAARPARQATLEVRTARVVLVPPGRWDTASARWWEAHPDAERLAPATLHAVPVGVVLVTEPAPPAGEAPVRWLLLTSLPVDTAAATLTVVRSYRYRWLIERFHFVLKSGCRVEQLQLGTAERLTRALAVYAGVAWRLLWLTYHARAAPTAPCTVVLDPDGWPVLCVLVQPRAPVPAQPPDLRTAVRAIAALGGFLGRKHDGEPGVQTLWRGRQRLHEAVAAWRLLRDHPSLLSGP